MSNKIQETIKQLKKQITQHNQNYYQKNQPTIADAEYDQLFQQLLQLEQSYPEYLTADSPTQQVGFAPEQNLTAIAHKTPILSLNNAFHDADILAFDKRLKKLLNIDATQHLKYTCELKFDGVAVSLNYKHGKLVQGLTRGDGYVGENITANVKTVKNIPKELIGKDYPDELEVRGEIFITKTEFAKMNRQAQEKQQRTFANPRNAAAGSIRQLDPQITATRPLSFCAYSAIVPEDDLNSITDQLTLLQKLARWGLPTSTETVSAENPAQLITNYHLFATKRHQLPFEIDGMVIKVNEISLQQKLGTLARSPRWAIAVKFAALEKTTTIQSVEFQVGRTGVITPVATLVPVEIGGVQITHASLHNMEEICRLNVHIGDKVMVKRAGDVIPKITALIEAGNQRQAIIPPSSCPACDHLLIKEDDRVLLRCPATDQCSAQQIQGIIHFASRNAMDIVGLGDKTIEQLVKQRLITDAADIYQLTYEKIITLPGFADLATRNLLAAIAQSQTTELAKFIYALGIREVGASTAKLLTQHFGTLEQLMQASEATLGAIKAIGPVTAQYIYTYFHQQKHQELINRLLQIGIHWPEVNHLPTHPRPLLNKTFVITGTFTEWPREQLKAKLEQAGGKVSASISAKTDYLLVGENPGSKLEKATQLGIQIIKEPDLEQMLK